GRAAARLSPRHALRWSAAAKDAVRVLVGSVRSTGPEHRQQRLDATTQRALAAVGRKPRRYGDPGLPARGRPPELFFRAILEISAHSLGSSLGDQPRPAVACIRSASRVYRERKGARF